MSDFFSGLRNVQFPDVVMNSGPLPSTDGLPAPLHSTADARINATNNLLENISPYAYGEPGYLSSQVSYVNWPHRIQKIFPELAIPRGIRDTTNFFNISHSVDDSDIAFVMRLDRASTVCTLMKNPSVHRYKLGTAIDPFINLSTLNYLLAGFQICLGNVNVAPPNLWKSLLHDLDKKRFSDTRYQTRQFITLKDIIHIVQNLITPFGVVRGSEKQGGTHELSNSPATWPVNFVGTLVIDGKEANINNYWYNHDVAAGDDVCLRLKPMPIRDVQYTLNHYYKSVSRQDFKSVQQNQGINFQTTHVWQLVPDIVHLDTEIFDRTGIVMPSPYLEIPEPFIWQNLGYWHIGRTQVHASAISTNGDYYNDDMANNLRLGHMEMTFTPTWFRFPGEVNFPENNVAPPLFGLEPARMFSAYRSEVVQENLGKMFPQQNRTTENENNYNFFDLSAPVSFETAPSVSPMVLNTSTSAVNDIVEGAPRNVQSNTTPLPTVKPPTVLKKRPTEDKPFSTGNKPTKKVNFGTN